jgi:predicted phosphate transport protein (TIGR00153 family)
MRILPREEKFFDMFSQMGQMLIEGAALLNTLLGDVAQAPVQAGEIKALEHKADNLTHSIITKLNQTFITPFDREDIHMLSTRLDDVLDLIDATSMRIVTYKIRVLAPGTQQLGQILAAQVKEIDKALGLLNRRDGVLKHCIEINRLEDDADRIARAGIGMLFEKESDPIALIKQKELYEVLELATDKCEDVANVIETIVLKAA